MAATSFEEPKLQALLEKIARDESFKHPKFAISAGSKPGDNYMGRIFRAVITEQDDSRSLSMIFKAPPSSKTHQEMLGTDNAFTNEGNVYQHILPTLNNFMKQHGVVSSSVFPGTARCLAVDLADASNPDDVHVIVLEDKSAEGFRMADRAKGLNADHLRVVLEYLAYWHASSLALHLLEPETAERLRQETTFEDSWKNDVNNPLSQGVIQPQLKSLEQLQEPYKRGNPVYDRLEKLLQRSNVECVRLFRLPPDLPCIIHGDSWTNNFLFKYKKDGTVEDACLIDLQLTSAASPAIDLTYLMSLCTTKETRDAHHEDLIRSYHNKVASILRAFGCDPAEVMSWDLLQDHLRRHGLFGVFSSLVCIPAFLADSSDIDYDVHSKDQENFVILDGVDISDTKKKEEISKRMTDVVADAARLGYF